MGYHNGVPGMPKRRNPPYLDTHGNQYRVQMKVPLRLRGILGKAKLIRPLHTNNLRDAEQLKWAVISDLKQILRDAERALATSDPIEAEALRRRPFRDNEGDREFIIDRAYEIERKHGRNKAKMFADLATAATTPLDYFTSGFAEHQGYRQKTQGDFERVLEWLTAYLRGRNLTVTIEGVSRKEAGHFISHTLAKGRGATKASAYLGFLRQYWKWLVEKGHAAENPWLGQSLPAAPRRNRDAEDDDGKRPFTDEEVSKLIFGPASGRLKDVMLIGALSGMRLEEICQLRVGDCSNGVFDIRAGKTESARRKVPIHSQLNSLVGDLVGTRDAKDYLIVDLPKPPKSRETRSDPLSKQFTRYRRIQKVDERPNDKAKSNVDFHSFRRWFIRKARDAMLKGNAGFDAWTFLAVVGHVSGDRPKEQELAMVGYAGPDAESAKRALIEAVKLPIAPGA